MSTTTWNQEQEVPIASSELGDSTGRDAVALLVAARKRAFDAEQHIRQVSTQPEPDCGSSSCIFSSNGGMRTNGPCRCYENAGFHGSAVMAAKQMLREVLLLRAKVDAAPKEVPPKWIKVTDRLPHVGQLVVGRAQLGKNRVRRILLTYHPDPKAPSDPPWMADDFALYSLIDVPMWAPIPSEEA